MSERQSYLDAWDFVVDRFISSREPFPGYWDMSETAALEASQARVLLSGSSRLLDVGCGRGRLLAKHAVNFQEVVAIEPDTARLQQAIVSCRATGCKNIRFIDGFFEDYALSLGAFDVVLCSHVIQHIKTSGLKEMVHDLQTVLSPGGTLILLTAFSQKEYDSFKTWTYDSEHSCVSEKEIDREDFDWALSVDYKPHVLPIRSFGRESLRALMPSCKLTGTRYLHSLQPKSLFDRFVFRDTWINLPLVRGRFGIDVLMTWKKER